MCVSLWAKQKNPNTIKQLMLDRKLVGWRCGKCIECLKAKRGYLNNKINNQLDLSKYCYLITLTFNNDVVDVNGIPETHRDQYEKSALSKYTTLNKYALKKIIINLRNKFKRYCKKINQELEMHYFCAGEYGENTKRAHYHIILMLNFPIPDLKQKPTKSGNNFTSKMLSSKQYGFIDIERINNIEKNKTANYLTKYLTKTLDKEFKYFKNYNADTAKVIYKFKNNKSNNQLNYVYTEKAIYKVAKQKPFYKMSKCLGLNIKQFTQTNQDLEKQLFYMQEKKVLNYYYKKKILNTSLFKIINSSSVIEMDDLEFQLFINKVNERFNLNYHQNQTSQKILYIHCFRTELKRWFKFKYGRDFEFYKIDRVFYDYYSYIQTLIYNIYDYVNMLLYFDKQRIKSINKVFLTESKDYKKYQARELKDIF